MIASVSLHSALIVSLGFWIALTSGCSPEVDSDSWCEQMVDKPKNEWTMNDANAFADNCNPEVLLD